VNVAEIMTMRPVTIPYDASIRQAMQLMQQHGFHHLPVISKNQHVVGMLVEDDCEAIQRLAKADIQIMTVSELMRPLNVIADPTMNLATLVRLMIENHISGLPVMLEETLVGIVTVSDLLRVIGKLEVTYTQ
jgi:acetoin utilization protein AcuB